MGHNSWTGKAELIERTRRETRAVADARALVEKWNADVERRKDARLGYSPRKHLPQFSPHVRTALLADRPLLQLHCPGCDQVAFLDLRTVVRKLDFPIDGLIDVVRCRPCGEQGPQPVMLGLFPAMK